MDYTNLPTPPVCVADFCLIPIGTSSASVSNEVAAVQRLMKASGLNYEMHSAGTTVEGPWDSVMRIIGQAHSLVHQNGIVRIQTDIRVGTRTDKTQRFAEKVTKVQSILASDSSTPATTAVPATELRDSGGGASKGDTASTPGQVGTGPQQRKGTWASILK